MNHSTDTAPPNVSHGVIVELIEASGAAIPITVEMRYRSADPYALTMAFLTPHGEVSWTFGRELLRHGLSEPSGDGDVHIFPCLDDDGHAVVIIKLCPPFGQALIQVETKHLTRFVARTTDIVPVGTESNYTNIDTTLAALLDTPAA